MSNMLTRRFRTKLHVGQEKEKAPPASQRSRGINRPARESDKPCGRGFAIHTLGYTTPWTCQGTTSAPS